MLLVGVIFVFLLLLFFFFFGGFLSKSIYKAKGVCVCVFVSF